MLGNQLDSALGFWNSDLASGLGLLGTQLDFVLGFWDSDLASGQGMLRKQMAFAFGCFAWVCSKATIGISLSG